MQSITFSDILIRQQFSEIPSRDDCDTTCDMGKFKLKLPVISANMKQITGPKMAVEMALNGGMGILHRFNTINEAVKDYIEVMEDPIFLPEHVFSKRTNPPLVGVSLGMSDSDKERFKALYDAGARIFCIDVAHGYTTMMRDMIEWIKSRANNITVIAGNVGTGDGAVSLFNWGADIAKVGIGPGKVCRTRSNAGVGSPQFSALKEVREYLDAHGIKGYVISDGGIKTAGCVSKALIYADAVMIGAVLSGTSETPGDAYPEPSTDLTNRTYYKMYGGSASQENKVSNGQSNRFNEGEMIKVPFKGHCKYLLREISDGIQSAMSYSGAKTQEEYKEKVKWDIISGSSKEESKF